MKSSNKVIITDIYISENSIKILFEASEGIEAWIENTNKHLPDVLYVDADNENQVISVDYCNLCSLVKSSPGQVFRLSLCTAKEKLKYIINHSNIGNQSFNDISVAVTEEILFSGIKTVSASCSPNGSFLEIQHNNKSVLDNIEGLPVETLVIGTCFSRNIFKSDEYFNPNYKKYFIVKKTLFHNSLISVFSKKIGYDYSGIADLTTGDAGKYVGMEFEKNIEKHFIENDIRLVVIDNYIDATTPIIKYDNSYLTYNKYLSESIFKRFFSSCEIIYPGTEKHLGLYRKSIGPLKKMLIEYDITNVILIGGRLNKYKIDEKLNKKYIWEDKMEWILKVNRVWDEVDKIFLEELSDAIYIDKRNTVWMNDIHSPILGGASPSHYQSGYYKELFNDISKLLSEDLVDE